MKVSPGVGKIEEITGDVMPVAADTPQPLMGGTGAVLDEQFRQIVENLPVAVYTTDADGRITFYNEAAANFWGRRPRLWEDLWCGTWRLYWPDGTPMSHDECPMALTLTTGSPVRGVEAIAERPDGSRYSFVPYPGLLYDELGRVTGGVNMLVDVTERKRGEEATQRLAAIVASSDDAIVSKTVYGIITSWNEAAERLFGYSADEIIGKSILTIIPPDRHDEETEIVSRIRRGERVEHYETVRRRKDGTPVDVSLTVSPIKRADGTIAGASKIARDITERKRAQALLRQHASRLETLNRVSRIIARDLDLERIVQSVTDIATELSGARFGAFFFNSVDEKGGFYQLCALSGADRNAFATLGMPRVSPLFQPTFAGTQLVRSDDIRKDSRYGRNALHRGLPTDDLPVVSYLAVPVVSSSGEVRGGLFFGHDEPGQFDVETETLISAIASQAAMAMDNARLHTAAQMEIEQRRRAEDAKELLLKEIQHRVKNTLATVQAMAMQTFHNAPPEDREAFIARLHALSDAHDLLTQRDWNWVGVGEMVRRALRPFLGPDQRRVVLDGADCRLDANKSLLLAMVLHELGTNAVKYGALSNKTGRISISWEPDETAASRRLKLSWRESGGPPVEPPSRKGFGTRMIEYALRGEQGAARFDFTHDGLICSLEIAV